jgi:hypothetical protein
MKYLFAAACALALTIVSFADPAQARGGASFRGAAAAPSKPAAAVYQRDHRKPHVGPGGGVRVYKPCYRGHCHSH